MALMGTAAVAMWWHIAREQRAEFLDWHTHEHLPERLAIEGFRRGTRWSSLDDATGFFVMYELASRATLAGPAYMARLNAPTPWSSALMPHHTGMVRSLAEVSFSRGAGNGCCALTVRLSPRTGEQAALRRYLHEALAAALPGAGIAGAHLLETAQLGAVAPTQEQRIRGGDQAADWVVVVVGYDEAALRGLRDRALADDTLTGRGAMGAVVSGVYGLSGGLHAAERMADRPQAEFGLGLQASSFPPRRE